MLFGSKNEFAIEAMVEPDLMPPSSAWGRLRVWCAGFAIGDFDNSHCGLPVPHFKDLGPRARTLWRNEFEGLSDEQLFNLVDARYHGCVDGMELPDARSDAQLGEDSRTYGVFDFLTGWGEMFDRCGKTFIFCPDGVTVRMLHRPDDGRPVLALEASAAAVTDACRLLVTWFDSVSEQLEARPTSRA